MCECLLLLQPIKDAAVRSDNVLETRFILTQFESCEDALMKLLPGRKRFARLDARPHPKCRLEIDVSRDNLRLKHYHITRHVNELKLAENQILSVQVNAIICATFAQCVGM